VKSLFTALVLTLCATRSFAGSDLVLGRQDLDPKAGEKDFGELLKSLEGVSNMKTRLQVRRFPSQIREDIAKGEVNLLIDTVYNLVSLDPDGNMIPALNIWKKGTEWHQGCIGTLASGKETGKSFKGKKVIMEEPYSTGSYALPINLITASGVSLSDINIVTNDALAKLGSKNLLEAAAKYSAPKGKVTVFFSGDDAKSPDWLKAGAADYVGAACKNMAEMADVKKLQESTKLPRQLMSFHKSFDASSRDKIIKFMMGLNGDSKELKGVKGTKVTELTKDQILITEKHIKDWKALFDFTEKVVGK
jgi:ABC-type phosphate/phosphonate transport system substrate-binding protein